MGEHDEHATVQYCVIDRFEGDWAVMEWNRVVFNFPRRLLPGGAKEGDVIRIVSEVDAARTADRHQRVRHLEEKLFRE
ncbi:MAG: DUF3006 domain-containing protein [Firmicutes bacterium]|nr:DUF3006 domain-containing protein [Candidatus Fermentithermobacillaceae bacterium]